MKQVREDSGLGLSLRSNLLSWQLSWERERGEQWTVWRSRWRTKSRRQRRLQILEGHHEFNLERTSFNLGRVSRVQSRKDMVHSWKDIASQPAGRPNKRHSGRSNIQNPTRAKTRFSLKKSFRKVNIRAKCMSFHLRQCFEQGGGITAQTVHVYVLNTRKKKLPEKHVSNT